ncbi:MAG: hypothetical protein ABJA10_06465, partial [Aestuariivirga sp.]
MSCTQCYIQIPSTVRIIPERQSVCRPLYDQFVPWLGQALDWWARWIDTQFNQHELQLRRQIPANLQRIVFGANNIAPNFEFGLM